MKKVRQPWCAHCPELENDVHRSFFVCSHFTEERERLNSAVDALTSDTVAEMVLHGEEAWREIANSVLRVKRDERCLADP